MDLRNLFRGKNTNVAPAPAMAVRNSEQPIELGTIDYCNLTADGKHGDFDAALQVVAEAGRPIIANFVEWSGCRVSSSS
jgi:hypothetical protein